LRQDPNFRGAHFYAPGHFYSPLLDISGVGTGDRVLPYDGPEYWENVPLREAGQRAYYEALLHLPQPQFPERRSAGHRYFWRNNWFPLGDAITLSGVIRQERPARIVEVGSGFSSAAMLDTLDQAGHIATLALIEPFPERLDKLLRSEDRARCRLLQHRVQDVPPGVFDELAAQDILFIDSSHVAKVGSDLTFLLLRVLPRLQRGVLVHFHDIFYPHSYPLDWIREGRAWNESLFLRAFLIGNREFEILAFNPFAAATFPELFRDAPGFLEHPGSSLWLRKTGPADSGSV
jgi:predicted O-methyltransferase YrrM